MHEIDSRNQRKTNDACIHHHFDSPEILTAANPKTVRPSFAFPISDGAIYLGDDQLVEAILGRATLRVAFLLDPGCVANEISTFLYR